ncbi:unnamed protein product [Staurois parvus]|uniref:Uncharacterized protein n=1 Tax=Staurois parvus TaxID=386267 RepID=A0ABN9EEB2_9NEOB|nr:unnamed protein product [Staurois parvus]
MPLVPFIGFFGCVLSVGKDTGAHDPQLAGGPMNCQSAPDLYTNCMVAHIHMWCF